MTGPRWTGFGPGSSHRTTIGVNLTWLVPGVVGGSEEYTVRLLQAVSPFLPDGVGLRLYGRADLARAYPDLVELHQFVRIPALPGGRAARVATEATLLAGLTRRDAVVHHAGGTVPLVRTGPVAVTVHDPQPLEMPENFGFVKRHWLGRTLPHAVEAARLVVCPSRYTADRLRGLLDVPEEKLRVVPHGYPLQAIEPEPEAGSADDDRSGPRHRSAVAYGRYLLYPAIAYPHKRHIDVVRLLDRLGPASADLDVVFTGRAGPESAAVAAEADRLGVSHRVHVLGRIPSAELEVLYRSAAALVFPSSYEGFGNPAVEAMGFGCPVIVSDAGALPEVVGDAGLIVPVGDLDGLAAAVTRVLTDPDLAADLRARGRKRAREFDVAIAAERLGEVYRDLIDIGHR